MSLFDGKDISQATTFSARGPDIAIIGFFLRWKCQRLGESENEKTKKWEGPEEAERRGSVSTKTPLKKKGLWEALTTTVIIRQCVQRKVQHWGHTEIS